MDIYDERCPSWIRNFALVTHMENMPCYKDRGRNHCPYKKKPFCCGKELNRLCYTEVLVQRKKAAIHAHLKKIGG